MELPKCTRGNCKPVSTERSYRVCDRFSIWCYASGCYRHAVGATEEEAASTWRALVQHEFPKDAEQDAPPAFLLSSE